MSGEDTTKTTAEATLEVLRRRRMLMGFALGTVQDLLDVTPTATDNTIPVLLDGDTSTINAQSLVGALPNGTRVPVLYVPPAGYIITGHVDDPGYVRSKAGLASFTFTSQTSASVAVTFDEPFDAVPVVTATIESTAGATNLWFVRAGLVTASGFTIVVSASVAGTWSNVSVAWHAVPATQ